MTIVNKLYIFTKNNVTTGFSGSKETVVYGSTICTPATISHSARVQGQNNNKSEMTITVSAKESYFKNLLIETPDLTTVSIIRNNVLYWTGVISNRVYSNDEISLHCATYHNSLKQRPGISVGISLHCVRVLYGEGCNVVKEQYADSYTEQIITSSEIDLPSMVRTSGYYTGGEAAINGQTRYIRKHVGTTITLFNPFDGMQNGTLFLYPGCDLTTTTCKTKFNIENPTAGNIANFLGFPRAPVKNIFKKGLF